MAHRTPLFEKQGTFFKVDEEQGIAYGWAIVCSEQGQPYFDLQGDHIPESAMVTALADFAKNSRVGKDQHQGEKTGEHVFLYPITKAIALGLGITTAKTGAIVGYKPDDPTHLDAIKNGTRTGFSIGGVLVESDDTEVGKAISKSYSNGKKKGRVFRTFKIHEISLVDRPAQEGATVGFVKLKRAIVSVPGFEKGMKLSGVADGHQHIVFLDDVRTEEYCGTTYDYSAGADDTHNHRVVVEDGVVKLSMNAGHSHSIEVPEGWVPKTPEPPVPAADGTVQVASIQLAAKVAGLTSPDTAGSVVASTMPQEQKMTESEIAALNKRIADAEAAQKAAESRANRYEKMAELSEPQRRYLATLSPSTQDSFLAKNATERQSDLDSATVFKAEDGTLYFRSDDPRLISSVKANEALAKSLSKTDDLRQTAEHGSFAKSTIGHFSGDDATKVALAKAIASISDEKVREAVVETLKGADAAIKMLAESSGHGVVKHVETNAEKTFYKARDEFGKTSQMPIGTDVEKAVVTRKFMQTPEGAALYRDYVAGQPARA